MSEITPYKEPDHTENGEKKDFLNENGDHKFKDSEKYASEGDYDGTAFGEESSHDIQYKTMSWPQTTLTLICETVALGILSIPKVFDTVGLVPGVILTVGLGVIATYTGYVLGQFRHRYPHVFNVGDVGGVVGGKAGSIAFGTMMILFLTFTSASHVLTGSIALSTISDNAICAVAFGAITAIACFLLTLPRTFRQLSYLAIVSFISVLAAVIITMVGTGVEATQKPGGISGVQWRLFPAPGTSFQEAFLAVTNIIFAYAGHCAFFSFIAEMRNPQDYTKALLTLQAIDISLYTITGAVIYVFVGAGTPSPALGATSPLLEKIAYGVAIPVILLAGTINGMVVAKYLFVRIFARSRHLHSNTVVGWGTWIGLCAGVWTVAFIIAEVIPFFNDLLGVIASLFVSFFTYAMSSWLYIYLFRGRLFENGRRSLVTMINIFIAMIGVTILGCGLYASADDIALMYQSGTVSSPFSCTPST